MIQFINTKKIVLSCNALDSVVKYIWLTLIMIKLVHPHTCTWVLADLYKIKSFISMMHPYYICFCLFMKYILYILGWGASLYTLQVQVYILIDISECIGHLWLISMSLKVCVFLCMYIITVYSDEGDSQNKNHEQGNTTLA